MEYRGFECSACLRWNDDNLIRKDVPEWWEELAVTDLYAIRMSLAVAPNDPGDVIARMSDSYRQPKNGE